MIRQVPLLEIDPKELKSLSGREIRTSVSRAVIFKLEHVSELPGGVASISASAAGLSTPSPQKSGGRALQLAFLTSPQVLPQLSSEPRSEVWHWF